MVNLGNKLKNLRLQLHMTQNAVGKIIGTTGTMIGYYEAGSRRPSFERLIKLAQLYHVSTDYLLGQEPTALVENKDYVDVSGLTTEERAGIVHIVEAIRLRNTSVGDID